MTRPAVRNPRTSRNSLGGKAWLALIFLPPSLIVIGLCAMFIWQGSKGGVSPKWKKPTPLTNSVPSPRP